MLKSNYDQYVKFMKIAGMLIILFGLAVFNIFKFLELTSANPQKITEYHSDIDPLAIYRHPLIAGYYLNKSDGNLKSEMMVVPRSKFVGREKIVKMMLKKINFAGAKFNKIIVITQKPDFDLEDALFSATGVKPETIVYGAINAENLSEKLAPYFNRQNVLLVWNEDLGGESETTGLQSMQALAQQFNLEPQTKDLLQNTASQAVVYKIKETELPLLSAQEANLKSFVNDYREELKQLTTNFLENTAKLPPYSEKFHHFWDKGAVVVTACRAGMGCREYGGLDFSKSLIETLFHNIRLAKLENSQANIAVYLLTENVQKSYQSEAEFAADLNMGVDGVLLIDGPRQGLLLPPEKNLNEDKKEFIKHLKIKSGLSPDYWSEKIKVYYFKVVRI